MKTIDNYENLTKVKEGKGISLVYLSRPECGVCNSLLPKVEKVLDSYPNIKGYYMDLNKDERVSGQFSIYTIPAILLFADGKEVIREARYISIPDLDSKIARIYNLIN